MRCTSIFIAIGLLGFISITRAVADDAGPSVDEIRAAIRKSIPLLEAGGRKSADQRKCFTCHNQAVPVFALAEAKRRGFAVDESNLKRQVDHTAAHLSRGREKYREGRGQGGKVLTAGYALWTLNAAHYKPDETTEAVVEFLLQYQRQDDHWTHPGNRPPSSGSGFTTTYVALRGLSKFGTTAQQAHIEARTDAVRDWILNTKPDDTEDRVFQLRAMSLLKADRMRIQSAAEELVKLQHKDGSWSQTAEMTGDVYATATALVALFESGYVANDSAAAQRAVRFLVESQKPDGSWHVVTRAEPFQTYYESGYPHCEDQFISITAAGWATLALLQTLPEP